MARGKRPARPGLPHRHPRHDRSRRPGTAEGGAHRAGRDRTGHARRLPRPGRRRAPADPLRARQPRLQVQAHHPGTGHRAREPARPRRAVARPGTAGRQPSRRGRQRARPRDASPGRPAEEIADEAFAIFNDHPRDGAGAELACAYYGRRLRSLSFPRKTPCCPRSCYVRRSPVLSGSPWIGYLGAVSRVMVGLQGQAGAGMSGGMLAGRAGSAWPDDAGLVRQDNGLNPVAQAEAGHVPEPVKVATVFAVAGLAASRRARCVRAAGTRARARVLTVREPAVPELSDTPRLLNALFGQPPPAAN